jgi:dimethylamine/trimethylamine dehydrogenase
MHVKNFPDTTFKSLKKIGDCDAPAIIAAAIYAGHKYARELEETIDYDNPFKHDRVFFEDG